MTVSDKTRQISVSDKTRQISVSDKTRPGGQSLPAHRREEKKKRRGEKENTLKSCTLKIFDSEIYITLQKKKEKNIYIFVELNLFYSE